MSVSLLHDRDNDPPVAESPRSGTTHSQATAVTSAGEEFPSSYLQSGHREMQDQK